MIRKVFAAEIAAVERASETEPSRVRVTMSDATPDRYGDTISHAGWNLEHFKRNPVILWGHDSSQPPVGKAVSVTVTDKALVGEIEFAPTEKGREVETLVRGGYVRAVSVGFLPKKYGPRKDKDSDGIAFEEQELLECSFVSIPANPNALVDDESRAARDQIVKSLGNPAEEQQHHTPPCAAGAEAMPENTAPVTPADASLSETQKAQIAAIVASSIKAALNTTVTDPSATIVAAARSTAPVTPEAPKAPAIRGFTQRPQVATSEKGLAIGQVAIAQARAKRFGGSPLDHLELMGHRDTADACEKALGISTMGAGGVLVPAEQGEMIDLLRAQSVVLQAGVRVLNMASDTMNLPRQTGASTAAYYGESSAIAASTQTFDRIQLVAKKLGAATVVSNEFLMDAGIDAERFVRDDLLRSCALKMDYMALTGSHAAGEPGGLTHWTTAAHIAQQTGTSYANWVTDLKRVVSDLESSDVPLAGSVFIMNPKTKNGLWGLQDALGNFVFKDEMQRSGTLWGYRYFITSQIPTSGAADRVYFFQPAEFVVGMRGGFEIAVGETYDSSGTTKSAFIEDGTVVRVTHRHDFALRHPDAAAAIHTVTI